MASVTAFEAKTRFGKLLERVTRGEEIVITRHDKPVARIVPEGRTTLDDVRVAAAALRGLRQRIATRRGDKPILTHAQIVRLIREGRR
jgi:prevent-host-death family protein